MKTCGKCNQGKVYVVETKPHPTKQPLVPESDGGLPSPTSTRDLPNLGDLLVCDQITDVQKNCCEKAQHENDCVGKASMQDSFKPKILSTCWLKAVFAKKATLLARVGVKLVKLAGPGYVHVDENGEAEVRSEIPIKSTKLLHDFNRANVNTSALLGDPLDHDYYVSADEQGNHYLQEGLDNQPSIRVWNNVTKKVKHTPADQFPVVVGDKLPSAECIEIVGFQPVPEGGSFENPRPLTALMGEGILVATKVKTGTTSVCKCDTCEQTETVIDTTTVIKFLPNPTNCDEDACYIPMLCNGEWSVVNPATIESLKGDKGDQGEAGVGEKGDQGERGLRGASVASCDGTINPGSCEDVEAVVNDAVDETLSQLVECLEEEEDETIEP